MNITSPRLLQPELHLPGEAPRPRASGITLWRPGIVLPDAFATARSPRVVVAEPTTRPDAVRAQLEATQSLLSSMAEAQMALGARAAAAERRAATAGSPGLRVAAVVEAYRIHAELDGILRRTLQRAQALLEERGLR
ncbi:MAG TPA: hypothetical protein VFR64_07305 [Methylomirabilota bacterium]|jgi:hypothetical protein|nr:hypothetical protein [Methylomirabilota bacterium]